jgi:hypothetical protein
MTEKGRNRPLSLPPNQNLPKESYTLGINKSKRKSNFHFTFVKKKIMMWSCGLSSCVSFLESIT